MNKFIMMALIIIGTTIYTGCDAASVDVSLDQFSGTVDSWIDKQGKNWYNSEKASITELTQAEEFIGKLISAIAGKSKLDAYAIVANKIFTDEQMGDLGIDRSSGEDLICTSET